MRKMSLDLELPLGLGLAMASRPEAVQRFSELPDEVRKAVVEQARNAHSRQEMLACVDSLMK